ncbi:MAG: hypothetical protein IJW17_07660 [Lentisphaeria bacterium]|nr:hypothetical protein [Lentisphaeria bacterium]
MKSKSMCKKVAAIKKYLIAAVVFSSMALPLYGKDYNWSLEKASGFGTDCKYSKAKKELTVSVTPKTGDWAGINLEHRKFGKDPDKVANWDNGFLVFEIKGGPDLKGVQRNGELLQVTFAHRNKAGKIISKTNPVRFVRFAKDKVIPADSFVEVRIPQKEFQWKKNDTTPLDLMLIQFSGNGKTAGGFTIRNVRFEIPEK